MKISGGLILFVVLVLWLLGVYVYTEYQHNATEQSLVKSAANLNDPLAPPIISERMRDPSWSIRYWLDVDKKSSDCTMADEIMDKGGNVKILTKRGSEVRRYYLSDYISSCQNRIKRSLEMVERPAQKWCKFKDKDPRLAELCTEWSNNKETYLTTIKRNDSPTLERYKNYHNK